MITKFGKRFLTGYLAGSNIFSGRQMAFGVGTTSPTENDTRLDFEIYRAPITFGAPSVELDGSTYRYYIIFKTTIPQDVAAKINEIAIYPGSSESFYNFDSKFISDFENASLWTDSGGFNPDVTTNSSYIKMGTYSMEVEATASSTKEYFANLNSLDISGYSVNDSLCLAYYKADDNLDSIKIRFYSSSTAYYEATIVDSPAAGSGYKIAEVSLSNMFTSPINSPDSKNISQISIIVEAKSAGATTVYLDGLRINDEDTFDPNFGMISRSLFTTELSKIAGKQVDVEYKMEINY